MSISWNDTTKEMSETQSAWTLLNTCGANNNSWISSDQDSVSGSCPLMCKGWMSCMSTRNRELLTKRVSSSFTTVVHCLLKSKQRQHQRHVSCLQTCETLFDVMITIYTVCSVITRQTSGQRLRILVQARSHVTIIFFGRVGFVKKAGFWSMSMTHFR